MTIDHTVDHKLQEEAGSKATSVPPLVKVVNVVILQTLECLTDKQGYLVLLSHLDDGGDDVER